MKAITAHKGENTLKMVKPRRSYLLNCVGGTEIMLLFILLAIEKLTYWKKKKVCGTALSMRFHMICYSIWFLEKIISRSALTLGANNEGQGHPVKVPVSSKTLHIVVKLVEHP